MLNFILWKSEENLKNMIMHPPTLNGVYAGAHLDYDRSVYICKRKFRLSIKT